MNELALFAGIHGLGLGLKRAFEGRGLPFRTVCYVEWNDYCCDVLKQRMHTGDIDKAPIWGNITTFDGQPWAGSVDIITGGFPCQDISVAGKGAGIEGERSGLFFELMRIVREVEPPLILLENVSALLIRGFGQVAAEMAQSGYDMQWDCIPAAAVGAPHRRDRVFIMAYSTGRSGRAGVHSPPLQGAESRLGFGGSASRRRQPAATTPMANAESKRMEGHRTAGFIFSQAQPRQGLFRRNSAGTQAGHWEIEPNVDRMANGIPARVDRLKALGNAVVPQVAEHIGERLIDWLELEKIHA